MDQSCPQMPVKMVFEKPLHQCVPMLKPHQTILFVTNPRVVGGQLLVPSYSSRILVDPDICVAEKLRRFLRQMAPPCNMTTQENADMEEYVLDDHFPRSQHLTTLHELQSTILKAPGTPFQVVVQVTITSICFTSLFAQERLFCMTCPSCFRAKYCNQAVDWCDCDVDDGRIDMRLNPQVLGGFSDETAGFLRSSSLNETESGSHDGHTPEKQDPVLRDAGTCTMFLTDRALSSLLGMKPLEIETLAILETEEECLETLDAVAKDLMWSPVILLLGWTGCGIVQPGEAHHLENSSLEDTHNLKNGRLVILDAAKVARVVPDRRS
ncbi:hypothetical protein RBB50_009252 [Rhinocladiella similis]